MGVLRKKQMGQTLLFSSWVVLLLGALFSWLAIFAGELAADRVWHSLCKPDVLDHHMELAYSTAIGCASC